MTLKEYIEMQSQTGDDDITIIRRWFCENDREQDGLAMIAELSKSKSDKLQKTLDYARQWLPNIPDMYISNRGMKKDDGIYLNRIATLYTLGCELPEGLLKWASETIPEMDTPKVIFIPMVEWLKNKYGIEFRDKLV